MDNAARAKNVRGPLRSQDAGSAGNGVWPRVGNDDSGKQWLSSLN